MAKFIKLNGHIIKMSEAALEKAAKATIGSTATWGDGKQYRKVAENKWEPVGDHARGTGTAPHPAGGHGDPKTPSQLHEKFRVAMEDMSKEHRAIFRGGHMDFEKKTFTSTDGRFALVFKDGKVHMAQNAKMTKAGFDDIAALAYAGKEDGYDEIQLVIGIQVEMEHTANKTEAMSIATDHLDENPNYYTELIAAGLVNEDIDLSIGLDDMFGNMEKARIVKYIKRIPKPSGKGFLYFYNETDYARYKKTGKLPGEKKKGGVLDGILSFFGLKSKDEAKQKAKDLYAEHKTELAGVDLPTFADYLNEYLSNKAAWDKRLSAKPDAKGDKKPEKKKAEKKDAPKKAHESNGKKYNLSVMKKIAGWVGGVRNYPDIFSKDKNDDWGDFKLKKNNNGRWIFQDESGATISRSFESKEDAIKYKNHVTFTNTEAIARAKAIANENGKKEISEEFKRIDKKEEPKITPKTNTVKISDFIGKSQLAAMQSGTKGEEGEHFKGKLAEMEKIFATMPRSYETDGQGDKAVAHLHYFTGGSDFYITELDKEKDQRQAFGYVVLNGDKENAELGYISIEDILKHGAELDLHYQPQTIGEIKTGEKPKSEPDKPASVVQPQLDKMKAAGFKNLSGKASPKTVKTSTGETLRVKAAFQIHGVTFAVAKEGRSWKAFETESGGTAGSGGTIAETVRIASEALANVGKEKTLELIAKFKAKNKGTEKGKDEKKSADNFETMPSAKKYIEMMLEMRKYQFEDAKNDGATDAQIEAMKNGIKKESIGYINKLKTKIESKDYDELASILHTGNKSSRAMFEEFTGVSLGKTDTSMREAVKKYVGAEKMKESEAKEKKRKEEIAQKEQDAKDQKSKEADDRIGKTNTAAKLYVDTDKVKKMPPHTRERVMQQLEKQWRLDGIKKPLREHIESGKFESVKMIERQNKKIYGAYVDNNVFVEIPKIVFDVIASNPNNKKEEPKKTEPKKEESKSKPEASAQKAYDDAKKTIEDFERDYKDDDIVDLEAEYENDMKDFDDDKDNQYYKTAKDGLSKIRAYRKAVKDVLALKNKAIDESGQSKMFKARIALEETLSKAFGEKSEHKYIKRIERPGGARNGRKYVYFYTKQQVEQFKKDGTIPTQKSGEKDAKPTTNKNALDDNSKHTIKNTLKKMANILSEALRAHDTVAPTGHAVEEGGESMSKNKKKAEQKKPVEKKPEPKIDNAKKDK